jgi:hypothetical protein
MAIRASIGHSLAIKILTCGILYEKSVISVDIAIVEDAHRETILRRISGRQWRSIENSSTWVRRMLLPDGSRNDVSIP